MALDLQHPEKVGVAERPELRDWKVRRTPWLRKILFYIMLIMIPVVIFGLMLGPKQASEWRRKEEHALCMRSASQ
jgi:hypothetical protein